MGKAVLDLSISTKPQPPDYESQLYVWRPSWHV